MTDFFDYSVAGAEPSAAGDEAVPAAGLLGRCGERERQALYAHSSIEIVRGGDALVRVGERDRSLFIVLTGSLSALVAGDPTPRGAMLPGDVFGEVAFFDGLPRSSTVIALEDSRVMRIRYESFVPLAAAEPALARSLLMDLGRALAGRLRAAEASVPPLVSR